MEFAPEARADLLVIFEAIEAAASASVALAYLNRLEAYCFGFELFAERGRARDDIRPGLRTTGFERRVTLVFSVDETTVTFLRLFYGGQDWERAFR